MKLHGITLTLFMLALQFSASLAVPSPADLLWIPARDRQRADLSVELKTLEGKTVSLEDFRNTVLLVNVWATWCQPCKEEMPAICALYDTLHKEGFEIAAVTNDDAKKVRSFLKKKQLPFTILIDSKEKLFKQFRVDRVPTALVIDKSGGLALRHTGPVDWTSPSIVDALRSLILQSTDQ